MKLEEKVAGEILRRARGAGYGGEHPSLDEGVLSQLVETVFSASLYTDEERHPEFSILYGGRAATRLPGGLDFERELPFTTSNLGKLGHAAAVHATSIVVRNDGNGGLSIVGLVHYGTSLHSSYLGEGFVPWSLNYLRISATAVGSLSVDFGPHHLADLVRGEFQPEGAHALSGPGELTSRLDKANRRFRSPTSPKHVVFGFATFTHLTTIRRLLRLVQAQKHGGAVLFVDETKPLSGLKPGYPLSAPSPLLSDPLQRCFSEEKELLFAKCNAGESIDLKNWPPRLKASRDYWDALKAVAHLTRLDGAVVLGHDLSLLAFSARINFDPGSVRNVKRCLDLNACQTESFSMEGVGMRHNSAAGFCAARSDAIVFVVSQDGPVSCWLPRGTEVLVWKPIALGTGRRLNWTFDPQSPEQAVQLIGQSHGVEDG